MLAVDRIALELVIVLAAETLEEVAVKIADTPVVGDDSVPAGIDDTVELARLVGLEIDAVALTEVAVPDDIAVETANAPVDDEGSAPVAVKDSVRLSELPVVALVIADDKAVGDDCSLPVAVVDTGRVDIVAVSLDTLSVPDVAEEMADPPVTDDTPVPVAVNDPIELDIV